MRLSTYKYFSPTLTLLLPTPTFYLHRPYFYLHLPFTYTYLTSTYIYLTSTYTDLLLTPTLLLLTLTLRLPTLTSTYLLPTLTLLLPTPTLPLASLPSGVAGDSLQPPDGGELQERPATTTARDGNKSVHKLQNLTAVAPYPGYAVLNVTASHCQSDEGKAHTGKVMYGVCP